jgi:hypothetical protein
MPLSAKQQQAILDALPPLAPCSLCEQADTWTLNASGVIVLRFEAGGAATNDGLACVAITCSSCGNTHLLDLSTLGLADFS